MKTIGFLLHSLAIAGNLPVAFGAPLVPLQTGAFGPQQAITTQADGPYSVYAADLDGDGDADVLSASWGDDKIAWYENSGSGVFGAQQVISTKADGARSVYAIDLDGDGDADVLSASASLLDFKIAWYENLGGGAFGSQQVITTPADFPLSVYATDLDGDGDADVLSASLFDDKIVWYENQGGGVFGSQQVISTQADNAQSVYATDLDGDGDADVLSASKDDDKVAWYENQGGGVFGGQQVISTQADAATSVYATDLDGDSDPDVLSASGNTIAWYENQGGGVFGAQKVITATASGASSVYASDLDGDGVADVLSASADDDKIAWYENLLVPKDCNGNGLADFSEIASNPSIDCNGNGVPDECDIASGVSLDANANGVPDECSAQWLVSDVAELNGAAGGSQGLTLKAGPSHALEFYLILGTLSGTSPGFPIGNLTLPLNILDPYFSLTLEQPNSAYLVDTLGFLDFQGTGSAAINVPSAAKQPSVIGLEFHHAYVTFGNDLVVTLTSNAVGLKILP